MKRARHYLGIDFGTAMSGWSYLGYNSALPPKSRTIWSNGPDRFAYPKAPTVVLADPEGELVAWGYDAIQQLNLLCDREQDSGYLLLRHFKMALADRERDRKGRGFKDPKLFVGGREFDVIDLVAFVLRNLKDDFITAEYGVQKHLAKEEEIRYCLSIPAMWEKSERGLMRTAAQKAGLIDDSIEDSHRLEFVKEPEAAAVYCRGPKAQTQQHGTVMILDCGGGTIDLTAYEVTGGGLKELASAKGKPFGAMQLDLNFRAYVENLLGAGTTKEFESNQPGDFNAFLKNWENIKCIRNPSAEEVVSFGGLVSEISREQKDTLKAAQDGYVRGIVITNTILLEKVFGAVIDEILNATEEFCEQVRENQGSTGRFVCDEILMVGGFSESGILEESVRRRFEGKEVGQVLVPDKPGSAVLFGSAAFLRRPSSVISRRADRTYGITTRVEYQEGKHPKERRTTVGDTTLVENVFEMFVEKEQELKRNQKKVGTFYPSDPLHQEVTIELLASSKKKVRFADELGVERLDEVKIPLPGRGGDREITVAFFFGDTDLKVEITTSVGGTKKTMKAPISYFSD